MPDRDKKEKQDLSTKPLEIRKDDYKGTGYGKYLLQKDVGEQTEALEEQQAEASERQSKSWWGNLGGSLAGAWAGQAILGAITGGASVAWQASAAAAGIGTWGGRKIGRQIATGGKTVGKLKQLKGSLLSGTKEEQAGSFAAQERDYAKGDITSGIGASLLAGYTSGGKEAMGESLTKAGKGIFGKDFVLPERIGTYFKAKDAKTAASTADEILYNPAEGDAGDLYLSGSKATGTSVEADRELYTQMIESEPSAKVVKGGSYENIVKSHQSVIQPAHDAVTTVSPEIQSLLDQVAVAKRNTNIRQTSFQRWASSRGIGDSISKGTSG